ncbi:hypothetical protein [Streptomyces sp. Mg1]|uniref:hypothetical protein n=1 Tax=Streptomyces sp. Mg1 TaxID=465541 RepID=UPI001319DB34|nr:hypothetical protein [Streptomyces sp. Mg1]
MCSLLPALAGENGEFLYDERALALFAGDPASSPLAERARASRKPGVLCSRW